MFGLSQLSQSLSLFIYSFIVHISLRLLTFLSQPSVIKKKKKRVRILIEVQSNDDRIEEHPPMSTMNHRIILWKFRTYFEQFLIFFNFYSIKIKKYFLIIFNFFKYKLKIKIKIEMFSIIL